MNQTLRINNQLYLRKKRSYNFRRSFIRTSILFITAVSAVLILLFCGKVACATESSSQNKYYKSIEIQDGDTLWSIAAKYKDCHYSSINDYISELKSINNLNSDMIIEGKKLLVCYYNNK